MDNGNGILTDKEKLKASLLARAEVASEQGAPVNTLSVLAAHPELQAEKSFVVELAFEEYLGRKANGEAPNPDEYCETFPIVRSTLQRLLALHQLVEHNPSLFRDEPIAWPKPGERWLGFQLREELGRGAFSRVFLAHEEELGNREVVLKVSRSGAAEADILGRLAHQHIVPVHAVKNGGDTGQSAIVMPYLGRFTLEDLKDGRIELTATGPRLQPNSRAKRRPLSAKVVFQIGLSIASALEAAHAQGVVHGDLKPSNVLIDDSGTIRILDFNLAGQTDKNVTEIAGTLPYMAPEQLRLIVTKGSASTRSTQSDLYSLGVILIELLTGRHPYADDLGKLSHAALPEVANELLRRQQTLSIPPLEPAAQRLLSRCVESEVQSRWSSATDVAKGLKARLKTAASLQRAVVRRPKTAALLVLLLQFVLGLSVATWASQPPSHLRDFRRAESLIAQGKFEEAIPHLLSSLAAQETLEARRALAYCYLEKQDWSHLIIECDQLTDRYRDPWAFAAISYAQAESGAAAVSAGAAREAMKAGLRSPEVLNNAAVSMMRDGQANEALKLLNEAIQKKANSVPLYLNRARCLLQQAYPQQATPAQAFRDLQAAMTLLPEDGVLHVEAAYLLMGCRRHDAEADQRIKEELSKAVRLGVDPTDIRRDPMLSRFFKDNPSYSLPAPGSQVYPLQQPQRLLIPRPF